MCMLTVKREVKKGYKLFFTHENNDIVYTGCNAFAIERGKWIQDKNLEIIESQNDNYMSGFHLYPTLQDVEKSVYIGKIYEVEYDEVVAEGTEDRSNVVVARRIKVGNFLKNK